MKAIGLGIIGASRIAARVIPSIEAVNEISIVGLASQSQSRVAAVSKMLPGGQIFSSYKACFESKDVDAVYISSINSSHFDLIMQALKSGKHVLCEKPLVLNEHEAISAFKFAKEKGLVLLEGLMYRHHPQVVKLLNKSRFDLGTLRHVHVGFGFHLYDDEDFENRARTTKAGGGGAINDLGCYAIDFINQVAQGEAPDLATCITTMKQGIDVEAQALLRYKSGLTATVCLSIRSAMLNVWEVVGSNGSIAALRSDSQGDAEVPLLLTDLESISRRESIKPIDCFMAQFRNFANSILRLEDPTVSPEDSILTARVSDMLRKSGMN